MTHTRKESWAGFLASLLWLLAILPSQAGQTLLYGPPGSGQFGAHVYVLPNGNTVVVDSLYTNAGVASAGAVYLYSPNLGLISTLTGSTADDAIGSGGVTILSNGNYVVSSPLWHNGGASGAGAATWCSGSSGVSGAVSAANSLVGSAANDNVGAKVTPLPNGNYVVSNPLWHGGNGEVTCCSGIQGGTGAVSSANSLTGNTSDEIGVGGITVLPGGGFVVSSPYAGGQMGQVSWCNGVVGVNQSSTVQYKTLRGSTAGDLVGLGGVVVLPNGNYLVMSPDWNYLGSAASAGAVTWCSGSSGYSGTVFSGQSLMGNLASESVGLGGVVVLTNSNYLVVSPYWNGDSGAITLCNGQTGVNTEVTSANSLTGCFYVRITVLSNGNYVLYNPTWTNSSGGIVGAVSFYSLSSSLSGAFPVTGSLKGALANDSIGSGGIIPLNNGNYVVCSPNWSNGVGAVTWCSGLTGRSGTVTNNNSLTGSMAGDRVGGGSITQLSNGNYVVCTPNWGYGLGAVTWCPGNAPATNYVAKGNSLIGASLGNEAGLGGITPLANGNYVVCTPNWANGTATNAGAVTWCNGSTNTTAIIAPTNSLVGNLTNELVGAYTVYTYLPSGGLYGSVSNHFATAATALPNGNYVVTSPYWAPAGQTNLGAVTWGSGTVGVTGLVSSANSLVGSSNFDQVGCTATLSIYGTSPNYTYITQIQPSTKVLADGNYVFTSPTWANGTASRAGAVTWGSSLGGTAGTLAAGNSLIGGTTNDSAGNGGILTLTNGDYVVTSTNWNNGTNSNAGAISWTNNPSGLTGLITTNNSVLGGAIGRGMSLVPAYNDLREGLVVGCPANNLVALLYDRISQTITFPHIGDQYSPGTVNLNATSSAGLPVTYTLISGPATLSGSQLQLNATGTVVVAASQPGDANTIPATSVTNTFSVTARMITITNSPSTLYLDGQGFHLQMSGFTSHGNIIIYGSTNLVTWQPIFTNPPVTGSLNFVDTNALNEPSQYYRVAEE